MLKRGCWPSLTLVNVHVIITILGIYDGSRVGDVLGYTDGAVVGM